jgi:hypothetical protein
MAPIHTYLSVFLHAVFLHAVKNKYKLGQHEFVVENETKTEGCTIFCLSLTLTGEKALGKWGNFSI